MERNLKVEPINYKCIECPDKKFTEEALEKIYGLLTIRVDGNILLLCHPRHIFEGVSEDFKTKIIDKVDWESINVEMMEKCQDYGRFSMVEQICSPAKNQFAYLKKKAKHMMKRYKDLGIENFSYPIAVVEGVYDSSTDNYEYYARAIICITKNGFAFGQNPDYLYFDQQKESVWQKALRMGDNY